ncbi:YlxR family protein [Catellatospora sp. TT07R-123]|uniref:YlxR family protein n=1 Tax=Catellatospora sp. TT07R-123 TaxID=2733863 RepID=UPI0027E431E8|nr:YlxR family protein [Catellatospora sp. TT07R-123]
MVRRTRPAPQAAASSVTPVPPPVRTCVGCRQRASAIDLLRVVAVESGADQFSLRPDRRRAMTGRGAHIHPTAACLESALRRRAFGRALRIAGVLDTGELTEAIQGP